MTSQRAHHFLIWAVSEWQLIPLCPEPWPSISQYMSSIKAQYGECMLSHVTSPQPLIPACATICAQSASWLFRMSGCSFWYRSVDSVFVTECAECYLSPEQTHKLHCCCGSYQCSASSPLPPCIPQTPLDDISLAIQHGALVTTDSLERVIVTVPGFTLHHRNTSTETLPRLFHIFRDLSTSSDIYTLIGNKPSELWFGGDSE